MKNNLLALILLLLLSVAGCAKEDEITSAGDCERIGAICNDGTRSNATGSGACSSHGGVKEWICR